MVNKTESKEVLTLSDPELLSRQVLPLSVIPCPSCEKEGTLRKIAYGDLPRDLDSGYFVMGGCCIDFERDIVCLKCRWSGSADSLLAEIAPLVYLESDFIRAVGYANFHHQDQLRKKTAIPYISHPLAVASLVLEAGGNEAQAIGALLHDVAEDCGGQVRIDEIFAVFGKRVGRIVVACSDATPAEGEKKGPYKQRKRKHIAHLRKESNPDVFIVTAADKLHNARAIVNDLEIHGKDVWKRFNAKDPSEIIWYYEAMLTLLTEKEVSKSLLLPLEKCIKKMKKYI